MLISATDEGDKLTDEELIHNVNTLFIGGQETSSASKHPDFESKNLLLFG